MKMFNRKYFDVSIEVTHVSISNILRIRLQQAS